MYLGFNDDDAELQIFTQHDNDRLLRYPDFRPDAEPNCIVLTIPLPSLTKIN